MIKFKDYFSLLENNDIESSLIDQLMSKEFNPIIYAHVTNSNFNNFKIPEVSRFTGNPYGKGFHFSELSNVDELGIYGSKVLKVYLKMKNPLILYPITESRSDEIIQQFNKNIPESKHYIKISPGIYKSNSRNSAPIKLEYKKDKLMLKFGNTDVRFMNSFGLRMEDVIKNMGYDSVVDNFQVVVYNPNNIKSSDLNTYDDNGNLILISSRFNDKISDIRY